MDLDIEPKSEHSHIDNINPEKPSIPDDIKAEQQVIRKCDWHVVPALMVLYLMAFLDRINIGNARLQGMEDDLNMEGGDYNLALFVFFIPYIICEIPCNLIMKKMAPSTWISSIMVLWGMFKEPIHWTSAWHILIPILSRYYYSLPRIRPEQRRSDSMSLFYRSLRSRISTWYVRPTLRRSTAHTCKAAST